MSRPGIEPGTHYATLHHIGRQNKTETSPFGHPLKFNSLNFSSNREYKVMQNRQHFYALLILERHSNFLRNEQSTLFEYRGQPE